jgi:hypothetical protein
MNAMRVEIDRVAETTTFNEQKFWALFLTVINALYITLHHSAQCSVA